MLLESFRVLAYLNNHNLSLIGNLSLGSIFKLLGLSFIQMNRIKKEKKKKRKKRKEKKKSVLSILKL